MLDAAYWYMIGGGLFLIGGFIPPHVWWIDAALIAGGSWLVGWGLAKVLIG